MIVVNIQPKTKEPTKRWRAWKIPNDIRKEVIKAIALNGTYEGDKWTISEFAVDALNITPQHIEQNFENVVVIPFDLEGQAEEFKKILRWLLGYESFPKRKDGEGAYYWRKHLRDKLNKAGFAELLRDIKR